MDGWPRPPKQRDELIIMLKNEYWSRQYVRILHENGNVAARNARFSSVKWYAWLGYYPKQPWGPSLPLEDNSDRALSRPSKAVTRCGFSSCMHLSSCLYRAGERAKRLQESNIVVCAGTTTLITSALNNRKTICRGIQGLAGGSITTMK